MNYINGRLTGVASANELEEEIQEVKSSKQDVLVSGNNIKTINNNSILGSGNLDIGSTCTWGSITGTLSNQIDLQAALNSKSSVGVSTTGTATDTVNYITVNGIEKKLAGASVTAVDNGDYITITINGVEYDLVKHNS